MAKEVFSQPDEYQNLRESPLDPEILKEIDAMVAHFRSSDELYAIKTEIAGWRDWEGIRHIDFGWMLFYIYRKTQSKGALDSRYMSEVMKRNPDLTQMAAKYLIQTIIPRQLTLNVAPQDKVALEKEIQAFMGRHQNLVESISNVQDISSIIETMYDLGVFLGRFESKNNEEVPSVNRAMISGYKLYSHPKLQRIMQTFWQEYIAGGKNEQNTQDLFPVTRKIIQGQGAKVISPEYQKFLGDPQIQNTLILPFQQPEILLAFFRNSSERIDKILAIGNSPKVSKWRMSGKWKDDREKHQEIRQLSLEILQEFFSLFGPFFTELTKFLEKNQLTWEYFLKNGVRLKDKGDTQKTSSFGVTPDNVLRGMVGTGMGYSTNYLSSNMFMSGVMNPETLGLLMSAFFVELFDIWGESEAKTMVESQLRKYGINFNRNTFGVMLNTTKSQRPIIHQRLRDIRDIMAFIGSIDKKKLSEIQRQWEVFSQNKAK